jgi:hypothetical protein
MSSRAAPSRLAWLGGAGAWVEPSKGMGHAELRRAADARRQGNAGALRRHAPSRQGRHRRGRRAQPGAPPPDTPRAASARGRVRWQAARARGPVPAQAPHGLRPGCAGGPGAEHPRGRVRGLLRLQARPPARWAAVFVGLLMLPARCRGQQRGESACGCKKRRPRRVVDSRKSTRGRPPCMHLEARGS